MSNSEKKFIKNMIKDLETCENFLKNKGSFVGDFVKIPIKDLAKSIRRIKGE